VASQTNESVPLPQLPLDILASILDQACVPLHLRLRLSKVVRNSVLHGDPRDICYLVEDVQPAAISRAVGVLEGLGGSGRKNGAGLRVVVRPGKRAVLTHMLPLLHAPLAAPTALSIPGAGWLAAPGDILMLSRSWPNLVSLQLRQPSPKVTTALSSSITSPPSGGQVSFAHLQELSLTGKSSVTSLCLSLPSLTKLVCVGSGAGCDAQGSPGVMSGGWQHPPVGLQSVNVSKTPALVHLDLSGNAALAQLDGLAVCTQLQHVDCSGHCLAVLDLGAHSNLRELHVDRELCAPRRACVTFRSNGLAAQCSLRHCWADVPSCLGRKPVA
jgi:hypothetical protein